jgi:hypothetical protein
MGHPSRPIEFCYNTRFETCGCSSQLTDSLPDAGGVLQAASPFESKNRLPAE